MIVENNDSNWHLLSRFFSGLLREKDIQKPKEKKTFCYEKKIVCAEVGIWRSNAPKMLQNKERKRIKITSNKLQHVIWLMNAKTVSYSKRFCKIKCILCFASFSLSRQGQILFQSDLYEWFGYFFDFSNVTLYKPFTRIFIAIIKRQRKCYFHITAKNRIFMMAKICSISIKTYTPLCDVQFQSLPNETLSIWLRIYSWFRLRWFKSHQLNGRPVLLWS